MHAGLSAMSAFARPDSFVVLSCADTDHESDHDPHHCFQRSLATGPHRHHQRQLAHACARQLQTLGVAPARIHQIEVPGAFEIPLMAKKLAESGKFDAVIGCAVIVNGGIYHHEFVSTAVVDGLMRVQLGTGVPVFSVALTPYNFQPSEDLQGFFRQHFIKKGMEAADACAQTLAAHANVDALLSETVQA